MSQIILYAVIILIVAALAAVAYDCYRKGVNVAKGIACAMLVFAIVLLWMLSKSEGNSVSEFLMQNGGFTMTAPQESMEEVPEFSTEQQ